MAIADLGVFKYCADAAMRDAASTSAARIATLFKDAAAETTEEKATAAKKKLDRLVADAKERKSKFAGVGMANIAKAMASRDSIKK